MQKILGRMRNGKNCIGAAVVGSGDSLGVLGRGKIVLETNIDPSNEDQQCMWVRNIYLNTLCDGASLQ